jgi:hypothetical protein
MATLKAVALVLALLAYDASAFVPSSRGLPTRALGGAAIDGKLIARQTVPCGSGNRNLVALSVVTGLKRVVVTGMGITSCLGNTVEDVKESLWHAKSGIKYSEKYAELGLKVTHRDGTPLHLKRERERKATTDGKLESCK